MTNKLYDDSNWREEYKSYTNNKRYLELLENGPKSLSQAWLLGALHNEWKKMKGYNKLEPKENKGQLQSSLKEFFSSQKDQGIQCTFNFLCYNKLTQIINMRIFLDTADTQLIQDGFSTGLIDGVTTNPTLIRKGGRDPEDVYKELIAMGVSDISLSLIHI